MASNFKQDGEYRDWTNGTGAAVASGDPIAFGLCCVAVALGDIANGETGTVKVGGIWEFPKNTSDAVTQGGKVWWDTVVGEVVNSPALGSWYLGVAANSELAATTTANVDLECFDDESARVLTLAATGTETLTAQDFYSGSLTVLVANTAAKTINLPAVASVPAGARLLVVKTGGGAFAITLDPDSSETINGASTYAALDADNDRAEFVNTGSAWVLVSSVIA